MRKKLGKIGKSVLSVIICLTMLLTTFCFFDIGSLISEASVGIKSFSSGVDPAVTFYVPETIYLAPTSGTMNTFQYYVDRANAVNGALRTGENTTGNVFFKCDQASSVTSITCSGATVSLSATSSSSNTLSTTINSGSIPTALSQNGITTLTWTVQYVVGGKTFTATSYTTVYAPYVNAVAQGYATRNKSGKEASVGGIVWVTGMHGYVEGKYDGGADCTGGMNYQPLLTTQIDQKDIGYSPSDKASAYLSWNGSGEVMPAIIIPTPLTVLIRANEADISPSMKAVIQTIAVSRI